MSAKVHARRILVYQLLVTLVAAAAGLLFEVVVALAILVGAGTGTVANAFFAWEIFRHHRTQDPKLLLGRFYVAETVKMVVIMLSFATAFVLIEELDPVVLTGAYFVVQVFPTVLASQNSGTGKTRGS